MNVRSRDEVGPRAAQARDGLESGVHAARFHHGTICASTLTTTSVPPRRFTSGTTRGSSLRRTAALTAYPAWPCSWLIVGSRMHGNAAHTDSSCSAALALVGMPINVLPIETIGRIIKGGESICGEAGIPIAGGHTIDSVEPIYGLVVMGLIHPSKVKRNADAKVGDVLVLGKPLGVGVLSAALKKDKLSADGYKQMIANTTQLNKPGIALAELKDVHALTDVTGFGLAGHGLELARGAKCSVQLDWAKVPLLPGVRELAAQGMVTGASGRNWGSYGGDVNLPAGFPEADRALLTDPQTSGGLLVSCAPAQVDEVLAIFKRGGFEHAAVIGRVIDGPGRLIVA